MADYNPITGTGIPTEPCGSLPRPQKLQDAFAAYDAGEITKEALEAEQGVAAKDSIERMEATGSPIVSDGEQRWSSFATYPFMATMAGTGLNPSLGPGGQTFALFPDLHYKAMPKIVSGPFRYSEYAADALAKSLPYATKPMKQAVIAPSMLSLLMPLWIEVPDYPRDQFLSDLVDECETDIRKAFDAGAARVSIDFTEGRLALKADARNPWTSSGLLPQFVDLISQVVDRFTPEERVNIGVHTCAGSDATSHHSGEVPYRGLLPEMFKINAGYFLIQCAMEEDKEETYKMIGEYSRDDANGVSQMCYVGVIWVQNPEVETAQQVCDDLVRAANYIPKNRLGSTDDCGFQPFAIDKRPSYGGPDVARDIAFQKIQARVDGTRMAAERLGIDIP
ncbi:MAG: 5-methyltetrahydropteroyltriglutamate--homocysteine methyltransferase [Pseudonocardiaceae bacterium]